MKESLSSNAMSGAGTDFSAVVPPPEGSCCRPGIPVGLRQSVSKPPPEAPLASHPEHLHHLIAQVIDDLDGDVAGPGPG